MVHMYLHMEQNRRELLNYPRVESQFQITRGNDLDIFRFSKWTNDDTYIRNYDDTYISLDWSRNTHPLLGICPSDCPMS